MRARSLTIISMLACTMGAFAAQANADTHNPNGPSRGGATSPHGSQPAATSEPVSTETSGGTEYGVSTGAAASPPRGPLVRGTVARRLANGTAAAPGDAPPAVQNAIWAANRLIGKPYIYGGGHGKWEDRGYDCSSTISYALHGAKLLRSPLDSGSFMSWGAEGRGHWITILTNPGHAFVIIAGLRLDTSPAGDPSGLRGPRWRPVARQTRGFVLRHPAGL